MPIGWARVGPARTNVVVAGLPGGAVVDMELIAHTKRSSPPKGPGTCEVAAIYDVKNGLLQRVWLIFGPKTVEFKKSTRDIRQA